MSLYRYIIDKKYLLQQYYKFLPYITWKATNLLKSSFSTIRFQWSPQDEYKLRNTVAKKSRILTLLHINHV